MKLKWSNVWCTWHPEPVKHTEKLLNPKALWVGGELEQGHLLNQSLDKRDFVLHSNPRLIQHNPFTLHKCGRTPHPERYRVTKCKSKFIVLTAQ